MANQELRLTADGMKAVYNTYGRIRCCADSGESSKDKVAGDTVFDPTPPQLVQDTGV